LNFAPVFSKKVSWWWLLSVWLPNFLFAIMRAALVLDHKLALVTARRRFD
jgi:hypothetical protein